MRNLVSVQPQHDYQLFPNTMMVSPAVVDLSELVERGVFTAWRDPSVFEAVSVGPHGEVRWSDDLELCADALYLRVTGKCRDLFPNLRASADA